MNNPKAGPFGLIARFAADVGGQVAVTFGICLVMLVTAIGGGLDLAHAYVARQQLSHAATLTCQYSTRAPVLSTVYQGSTGVSTYVANVDNSSTLFLTSEKFPLTQTNAAPFSYSRGGASTVNLSASMPTNFLRIVGLNTIPVGVTITCNANETQVSETQSPNVFTESFEAAPCSGTCYAWIKSDGSSGAPNTPSSTFPAKASYVGATGTEWSVMGYCLEVDSVGEFLSSVPDGSHSAELDCDNGSGNAGNSSISNKNYYTAGTYELRYDYVARVQYNNYAPTYICGSTAADVAWANDTDANAFSAVPRTNQINVYFDQDSGGAPPTHTTLDGTQTLAGANVIDECVYSYGWIERSIKITVTTPGYYWTSFAADGSGDSFGGSIDNLRMCRTSCSGTVKDDFPSTWTGGKNLFEDTFESPIYTQDPFTTSAHAKGGNLALSYGTSGTSSSGWPSQSSSGWAVAPYNEVNYWMQGATQGNQFISVQGWNGDSTPTDPLNRSINRSFYLDPGYYSISYDYTSLAEFSYSFVYSGGYYPICTPYPTSAPSYNTYGIKNGRDFPNANSGTLYAQYLSTNFLNVYLADGQLVSTPTVNSTLGGAPNYTNPDGTVTTTPTTPLDNGTNFSAYNSSAVNPVIETCFYSGGFAWVRQTLYVRITKPGRYWLAFSALGDPLTGVGAGAGVDDVTLTAVNSLYGSAPNAYATIPTPSAAPGSSIAFTGFSIIADPLTP